MCPIDACIQCDFDAANCILTSDQSPSAIEACFAIFDSCLETNQCFAPSVGGEFLPIETTSLLLAAASSPASWLTSLTIAALGIGVYVFTRNPNNMRNIKIILRDYLDRF